MSDSLRLLRYNTGTDKKAFVDFKQYFDAVIFNATIVAYSGSAVADLVSVHKNRFIIDPQTHIFQHKTTAIKAKNKNTGLLEVKKSVEKYLDEMPKGLSAIILHEDRPADISEIKAYEDDLVEMVYKFQNGFIDSFIEKKEYSKYLDFVGAGPKAKLLIAPYFMIKSEYSDDAISDWFALNRSALISFSNNYSSSSKIAAQLVLDKRVLIKPNLRKLVIDTYSGDYCEYVFIWIDDFNSMSSNDAERLAFYNLLGAFRDINKKPIMAYGGYESIFLCHEGVENRMYGVAQSVGYGEAREITPVGGGLPVNKYYFYPLHQRLNFSDAASILNKAGFFDSSKSTRTRVNEYYKTICSCEECHLIIGDDINHFNRFNESTPFTFKKSGVKRNLPTADASLSAAKHFLWCKIREWDFIKKEELSTIRKQLLDDMMYYDPSIEHSLKSWCELYAR